ncbi:MAG: type II secretion system protein [Oscillospiraceae bacterium]
MRRFLGKKGFSLLELVVVIAIIGVLLGMIVPTLSSRDANKNESILAARDFYSAAQNLFSKYSKYEDYIYYGQKDEAAADKIMDYNKQLGGNYPVKKYVGIAMCVRKSKIEYLNAVTDDNAVICEMKLYQQSGVSDTTNFEKMFTSDIEPLFARKDGIYYAYVTFENNEDKLNKIPNTNAVKVLAAGYCPTELPPCGTDYDAFRNKYLLLTENGMNANGDYLGVCSSVKDTVLDTYIGYPNSYFSLYFKPLS